MLIRKNGSNLTGSAAWNGETYCQLVQEKGTETRSQNSFSFQGKFEAGSCREYQSDRRAPRNGNGCAQWLAQNTIISCWGKGRGIDASLHKSKKLPKAGVRGYAPGEEHSKD